LSIAPIVIDLTKASTIHARAHQIRAHRTLIALAKEQGAEIVFQVKCGRAEK
jgi:hypothetical protein